MNGKITEIKNDLEKHTGIYRKYSVKRLRDKEGKHKNCFFFVLDLNHDKYAIPALRAYAKACKKEYPELAKDLIQIVENIKYMNTLKTSPTFQHSGR